MKRIETQVGLPAAPSVVWEQLVDTAEVGERLEVRVAPVGGRPMTFKPRVTVVEPHRRLEWLGSMAIPGLFDGRHSFTLTAVGEDAHGSSRRRSSRVPSSRSPESC